MRKIFQGGINIKKNTKEEFFEKSLNSLAGVAEKITDSITLQVYAAKIKGNSGRIAEIVRSAILSKSDEREDISDYKIKGLVGSLSLIGEFELAREAAATISDKNKAAEAMLCIAKESRDLEDLRNIKDS